MQQYMVIEKLVTIGKGEVVEMSAEQHGRRKLYCLPKVSAPTAGAYELTKPMQFKNGEIFGCDFQHNPPRFVMAALAEHGNAPKPDKAAPEPAPRAKAKRAPRAKAKAAK